MPDFKIVHHGQDNIVWSGLSTDTKPTLGLTIRVDLAVETDTLDEYTWYGVAGWVRTKIAGVALSTLVSSTGVAQGTVVTVLDAQTGDVTGAAVPFGTQSGIVHATIDTTGAKTCTISLYGSINADKSDPQLLFTFAMETTATGTDTEFGFITAQWPYVYGVISATAGAGTLDSADLDVAV